MQQVLIKQGSYRGEAIQGQTFDLVKEYQAHSGKPGGFVTVEIPKDHKWAHYGRIRVNLEKPDDAVVEGTGNTKSTESDEDRIEHIRSRFAILDQMASAVASQKVRAMIVSGPPGIGKSFGVEQQLAKLNMFEDVAGRSRKFEVVKGAMSAIGLYKKMYEHKDKGHVIVFDDCDAILYDDLALNLLKAALDSGRRRTIHWNTESRVLYNEGVPNQFDFDAGIIFITNVKFEQVKSKKLQGHLQALQSRCHYLDLSIDSVRDRMLRIHQITSDGMLDKYNMAPLLKDELLDYIADNKNRLRELSLRMVLKIADLMVMDSKNWRALAEATCMRRGI
jgi:hypothetical protein